VTSGKIIAESSLALAIYDVFPVTAYHALVIPRRHAATWFDLYEPERRAVGLLLDEMRLAVQAADGSISGFNVGMNCGEDSGQTIPHAHVHLGYEA